jgi:hypothetical protein
MWWTRRARDQALEVSLWIGIVLGIFAVKAKNIPRDGVQGVSGIGAPDSGSSSPWVSKVEGFNSSSRDDEAPLVELAVVLFFLVDILGLLLKPSTNGGLQLLWG